VPSVWFVSPMVSVTVNPGVVEVTVLLPPL
jgi:hypothetical protein